MLQVSELSVVYGYGRNRLTAVDAVSFAIPAATTLALVGESGSGKSTVARAIVGLAPAAAGEITLDGQDVGTRSGRRTRAFRRRVQMVFQDPFASLDPRMSVGATLSEAVGMRGEIGRRARSQDARRLLGLVGLSDAAMERFPHEFSGGQRQRIAIARALAVNPDVLIMDEVTSSLDVSVQATILNLLKDLQQELRLGYLFISHDLSIVATMSDRVAVMYLGRVVEAADAQELLGDPQHPYTRGLMESVPGRTIARTAVPLLEGETPDPRNPPSGCHFRLRCPVGVAVDPTRALCCTSDPRDDAAARSHRAECHYVVNANTETGEKRGDGTRVVEAARVPGDG